LRAALDAARQEQAESELAKRRTTAREAEIAQLKEQMADLQLKALQLDAYRKQLETLQNQSNDTSKRMQVLAEENSRLKRLAEEKSSNVASLESRIVHLSKEVEADGRRSSRGQLEEELKQLRTTLAEARAEQLEAERMKKLAANRESEIVQLKEQLNDLNKRSQQLEDYRKQILVLQKENAEKTKLLDEKGDMPKSRRPVLVPSF
jgi:chromosome segregation ATPase